MTGSVAVGSDRGQREMFPWTVLSVHQLDTQIHGLPITHCRDFGGLLVS